MELRRSSLSSRCCLAPSSLPCIAHLPIAPQHPSSCGCALLVPNGRCTPDSSSWLQDVADDGTPYARLINSVVLPPIASALTNEWEPRMPEPALQLLEEWQPALPASVYNHIVNDLVYPKVCHTGCSRST